jgi:prevent-host-death family protein
MAVNIHEAKTHFSKLIDQVIHGEEITIAKGGRPVARLIPIPSRQGRRASGSARGRVVIRKDFEAPLPKTVLQSFE